MSYVPYTERFGGEPDWSARFDACLARLKEIDAEETRLHLEFIADMRGLICTMEAALAPELTEGGE